MGPKQRINYLSCFQHSIFDCVAAVCSSVREKKEEPRDASGYSTNFLQKDSANNIPSHFFSPGDGWGGRGQHARPSDISTNTASYLRYATRILGGSLHREAVSAAPREQNRATSLPSRCVSRESKTIQVSERTGPRPIGLAVRTKELQRLTPPLLRDGVARIIDT